MQGFLILIVHIMKKILSELQMGLSRVTGTGFVVISKNLTLNSVLLVPNLDCNLLSISKHTQELNCVTKFFPNLCEFQDLNSGKTIGNAKICSGLHILKARNNKLTRQIRTRQTISLQKFLLLFLVSIMIVQLCYGTID